MKTIPSAWLGFSAEFMERDELVARVCMSCEDRPAAEAIALACGYHMTHGLCPACAARLLAELDLTLVSK